MRRRRTSLRVVAALAVLVTVLSGTPSVASSSEGNPGVLRGTILQKDSRGQSVLILQRVLSALGYDPGPQDGVFGPRTLEAVKLFQKDAGVTPDGVVGPRTVEALEKAWAKAYPPERYVVQPGETLSMLCARFGLSLREVVEVNGIKDPDLLYAGQVLLLKPREHGGSGDGRGGPDGPGDTPGDSPSSAQPSFPEPDKKICLTFNDGPDPETTPRVLDILSEYGVPCVFFVIGKRAAAYPELVRDIHERGHTVGVHGYEHVPLVSMSYQAALSDLFRALNTVEEATGTRPTLWRPPGGAVNALTYDLTRELGLTLVMWTNICGADLGASGPEEVVTGVLKYARDGAIILLHETNPYLVDALPRLIEELAKRGYAFQLIR